MAFSDQALLSVDPDFLARVSACVAAELGGPGETPPTTWAANNIWLVAAAPGFGDAYASAIAGGIPRPGNDPAVISDAQILAAVQALVAPP